MLRERVKMQVSEFGEYGYPTVLVMNDHAKMQVCEFGEHDHPTVLYISEKQDKDTLRSQLSCWKDHFHIVAPVFHNKKEGAHSVQDKAELIAQYMQSRYHGNVYAICGFESSWAVVDQPLKQSKIISQKTIVETDGNLPDRFMKQLRKS